MRDRDDDAASRKHVGGVARIARRGVQAEGVLDAHIGRAELGQIAEDAVIFGHVCIFRLLRGRALGEHSRKLAQAWLTPHRSEAWRHSGTRRVARRTERNALDPIARI